MKRTLAGVLILSLATSLIACDVKSIPTETSDVFEPSISSEETTTLETTTETTETTIETETSTEVINTTEVTTATESIEEDEVIPERITSLYSDVLEYEVQYDETFENYCNELSRAPEYMEFEVSKTENCDCSVCVENGGFYYGATPNAIDGIDGVFSYVIFDFDNDGDCELVTFSLVKNDYESYHSDYLFSLRLDCYTADENGNVTHTDSFDYYPYNYLDYSSNIDMTVCSITSTPNTDVSFDAYIIPTDEGATLFISVNDVSNGMLGDGGFVSCYDLGITPDGEFMVVAADVQHGMGSSDFNYDYYFFDDEGNVTYQGVYSEYELYPRDIPSLLNLSRVAYASTDLQDFDYFSGVEVFTSGSWSEDT